MSITQEWSIAAGAFETKKISETFSHFWKLELTVQQLNHL